MQTTPRHGNVARACLQRTDSNLLLSAKIFKFTMVSKQNEVMYHYSYDPKYVPQVNVVCDATMWPR